MRLSRRATIVVVALVVMMGAAIGAARWWNDTHPTGIKGAVAALPVSTQSFQFTDWSGVRIELRVMQGQEISKLGTWLDPATYPEDSATADILRSLPSTSIISTPDSAVQLQKELGISPANLQWEAYGNLPAGGVEVLSPNATVDLTKTQSALAKAGYAATKSGAWSLEGGSSTLPDFSNIAVLPDRHLFLASASPAALTAVMQSVSGKAPALDSVTSLKDMIGNLDQPVVADVWVRDSVCGDPKISYSAQAAPDPSTEQEISQAIKSAGGVTPLVGFVLTLNPDGTLTAAMQYPSDAAAQRDLKARATLATGQRYSIGVNFSSLFTLVSSQTNNSTILLQLKPVPGSESSTGVPLFPWLVQGDLDFASC